MLEQPGSALDTNKTNTEKNILEFYPVGESSSNVIPLMPNPLTNQFSESNKGHKLGPQFKSNILKTPVAMEPLSGIVPSVTETPSV